MLSIKEKPVKTVQRHSRCQGGRKEEMKVEIYFKLKGDNNKRDRLYQRLSDTDP